MEVKIKIICYRNRYFWSSNVLSLVGMNSTPEGPLLHNWPSNRCPSIGFLSRADREIRVFQRVAPTTRLRLEFPRETGLILRCAGKVRNPFQTKQGNRPSRRDQEGIRGSEQAVHRTLVFPLSDTRVSGNFCDNIKVANYHFKLQDGT